MTIQEAAGFLVKHLNDPETFIVSVRDNEIFVDVNWIYRKYEIDQLGGSWNGFPVKTGRISCW
jgi:hypothetical protein